MTTRQVLDRAVERALNADIRLLGAWDTLDILKGNEGPLADAICALSRSSADLVGSDLVRCDSVQDVIDTMERNGVDGRATVENQTESLFA